MRRARFGLGWCAVALAGGCSSTSTQGSAGLDAGDAAAACIAEPTDGRPAMGGDGGLDAVEAGRCRAIVAAHPDEGAQHETLCSPTCYQTNPPSSGNHYGAWAAYKTYTATFPAGFWVHNLEHGAVVITYNCPNGCPDEVAAAQRLIGTLPTDPVCTASVARRIIMLPDPQLNVRFAASSWGFTLTADCFDPEAFGGFIAAHYNHGREDVCGDGVDPLTGSGEGGPLCP